MHCINQVKILLVHEGGMELSAEGKYNKATCKLTSIREVSDKLRILDNLLLMYIFQFCFVFLAVQNSSIGDLVTHSLTE